MKNKILPLLVLGTTLGLLSGCNKTVTRIEKVPVDLKPDTIITKEIKDAITVKYGEQGETIKINDPSDPINSKLKAIKVLNTSIHLFIGGSGSLAQETAKINYDVEPFNASVEGFKFSSSDENVATVDANGNILAIAEGKCDITVSNADGSIKDSAHVVVNKKALANKYSTRKSNIAKAQASIVADNVLVTETYSDITSNSNGEITKTSNFTEKFYISKSNSYFRLVASSLDQEVGGGSLEQSRNDYIFYTNENYFTYVFRNEGQKKNYMVIDQAMYFDDPTKTRYDALCEVIGNFFTGGSKVITQQLELVKATSELTSKQNFDIAGCLSDTIDGGQLGFEYTDSNGGRLGQEDADYFELPVGTKVSIDYKYRFNWEHNLTSLKHIQQKMTYELKNVEYINDVNVDYYFQTENVEMYNPCLDARELSKFSRVTDIFEL